MRTKLKNVINKSCIKKTKGIWNLTGTLKTKKKICRNYMTCIQKGVESIILCK